MMYDNKNLIVDVSTFVQETKKLSWRSPSNIALVKYWGKYGRQYPKNPSISITLRNAYTDTSLQYQIKEKPTNNIALQFTFEGKENAAFAQKIVRFFESITPVFPFLTQFNFTISSHNSFPHSSGIASSASSMSALALCLCSMERNLFGTLKEETAFLQKASYIARLGSGSAARSVYPKLAIWGETTEVLGASNDYAVAYTDKLHPFFENYHDDILIVSRKEKAVSSRAGHALMNDNPYANVRYEQANTNLKRLLKVLKTGDATEFIEVVETEALVLHALMMCSKPSFILMQPNTLSVIQKIQAYREATKLPICFTLDAGPNVHVLYPHSIEQEAKIFIKNELLPFCEDSYYIEDGMGNGATLV